MNNHEFINQFESLLSEYTGAPYVVLTDSCTNAVFLCLRYLKSGPLKGVDKVSVPKHNYVSVPMQVIHAGFQVEFVDESWSGIYQLGNTPVYDAAQKFTSNMYIENAFMCLSFQQKKILSIGKGGAILLSNKSDYDMLKRLAWDGRDSSVSPQLDQNIVLGYHMNMTPEMAAAGILKLNMLPRENRDNGSWEDYPDVSGFACFRSAMSS